MTATQKAERRRKDNAKAGGYRQQAGELEARAMTIQRQRAVLEGEAMRLLIQAEVLRWRADETEGL